MCTSDKLKFNRRDVLFFFLPFLILSIMLGIMGHSNATRRIEDINRMVEDSTLDIAESYGQMLSKTQELTDALEKLNEEKLILVGESILLLDEEEISNSTLKAMAKKYGVMAINIFDDRGEMIFSNDEENLGWVIYDKHPAHDFLISGREIHIEDIREGSISGNYFKFAYLRRQDKTFVQIGMEAEEYGKFARNIQAKKIIDSIKESKKEILHIFLIDTRGKLIASDMDIKAGSEIDSENIRSHLGNDSIGVEKKGMRGKEALHAYVPMEVDNKKIGLLSIVWDTSFLDKTIKEVALVTLFEFTILGLVIAAILYYAYQKDKSNLKLAYYDRLTGLPNKEHLDEYIDCFLKDRGETRKVIYFINLSNFKLINMTYGYKYGD